MGRLTKVARRKRIRALRAELEVVEAERGTLRVELAALVAEEAGIGCGAYRSGCPVRSCRSFQADRSRGSGCAHQPTSTGEPADQLRICEPMIGALRGLGFIAEALAPREEES